MRTDGTGTCDSCNRSFNYSLIHNGFNDSVYAYCDQCGITALFNMYQVPKVIDAGSHGPITPAAEELTRPCDCGGHFRRGASPRCNHCKAILSAERAADYIERNAPGWAKGWRWQRSWNGAYAIVIEGRFVDGTWRKEG